MRRVGLGADATEGGLKHHVSAFVGGSTTGSATRLLLLYQLAIYASRFVRLAILARLVTPEDFGIFGLATVLISACVSLTALGPKAYLIQHADPSPSTVRTVWTVEVLRGIALAAVACAVAPLYAGEHGAGAVRAIQIAAISIAFLSIRSPRAMLAERAVEYGRVVAADVVGAAVGFAATIGLGYMLRSATALATGLTLEAIAAAAASWIFLPGRPQLGIDWTEFRLFVRAGSRLLVVAAGTFVMTQGDFLIVEERLGVAALGVYLLAFRLAEIPAVVISNVGNRLAIPVLGRARRERGDEAATLRRILSGAVSLSAACALCLASLADPAVRLSFGATYVEGVTVCRILAVLVFARSVAQIIGAAITARGEFGVAARMKVVEVAAFVVGVMVGVEAAGLNGVAIGVAVAYAIAVLMRLAWCSVRYEWSWLDLSRCILGDSMVFLVPTALTLALNSYAIESPVAQMGVGGGLFLITGIWWMVVRRNGVGRLVMRR